MKNPADTELVNRSKSLSENEMEDHHKGEVLEKEMNIQTHAKFEQKNHEELKDFSPVKNPISKIETTKKRSDLNFSLNKPSKLT